MRKVDIKEQRNKGQNTEQKLRKMFDEKTIEAGLDSLIQEILNLNKPALIVVLGVQYAMNILD